MKKATINRIFLMLGRLEPNDSFWYNEFMFTKSVYDNMSIQGNDFESFRKQFRDLPAVVQQYALDQVNRMHANGKY